MVNHRYEISNYKTKERVSIPAENHIIVADRHEAIVSREDFERVQQLIKLRHRPKKHEFQNFFQKLTFCAECGHHMTMMMKPLKSGTYPLIRCTNHFQNLEECTHHHQIYYEDFAEDLLDSESYHEMLSEYTQEQKRLSARLSVIDVELNSQEDYEKSVEKLKSVLEEYLTIEELTETMVNQLIERIGMRWKCDTPS